MTKISHDSETPAQGQQVFTACAFIHHDFDGVQKVFFAKRADTKKFMPGVHELPGGHIDYGENIVEGLKREVYEEFGVQVNIGDPFAVFDYTNEVKGSHSVEIIYFATLVGSPDDIALNPEDHSGSKWLTKNEAEAVQTSERVPDDPELENTRRGFALLEGAQLDFGA